MPGGDRTGPMGMGPMTGRAAGYCAGYSVPGYMNPVPGRGWYGFGRGGGRGWFGGGRGRRNWYYATGIPGWGRAAMGLPAWGGGAPYPPGPYPGPYPGAYPEPYPYGSELTPDQEKEMLQSQGDFLKQQMEDIQERIRALEKASAKAKDK